MKSILALLRTFPMGTDIKDQQVGCLWSGNHILSIGLSGQIAYLDRESQRPLRIIRVKILFTYSLIHHRSLIHFRLGP